MTLQVDAGKRVTREKAEPSTKSPYTSRMALNPTQFPATSISPIINKPAPPSNLRPLIIFLFNNHPLLG